MIVRRLGSEDVAAFLALRLQGFKTDPDVFRFTAEDDAAIGEARWAERLRAEYVIAAELDGRLVARGGLATGTGQKVDHKGLIWGMYVAPAHRGTGVASRVMQMLLDEASRRVRQVVLTVIAANIRARAFYERHGFAVYGIEPEAVRLGSGYVDEALMWRRV